MITAGDGQMEALVLGVVSGWRCRLALVLELECLFQTGTGYGLEHFVGTESLALDAALLLCCQLRGAGHTRRPPRHQRLPSLASLLFLELLQEAFRSSGCSVGQLSSGGSVSEQGSR